MPRYSLRNQTKIKEHFDQKTLSRIIESLDSHFNEEKEIIEHSMPGFNYKAISVDDSGNSCGFIIFFVVRKTFDVYNLAFKEFIN